MTASSKNQKLSNSNRSKTTSTIDIRFDQGIEELMYIREQLQKHFQKDLVSVSASDNNLDIFLSTENGVHIITIFFQCLELCTIRLRATDSQYKITANSIIQVLEGCWVVHIADWPSAVSWICERVVRLASIANIWTKRQSPQH